MSVLELFCQFFLDKGFIFVDGGVCAVGYSASNLLIFHATWHIDRYSMIHHFDENRCCQMGAYGWVLQLMRDACLYAHLEKPMERTRLASRFMHLPISGGAKMTPGVAFSKVVGIWRDKTFLI